VSFMLRQKRTRDDDVQKGRAHVHRARVSRWSGDATVRVEPVWAATLLGHRGACVSLSRSCCGFEKFAPENSGGSDGQETVVAATRGTFDGRGGVQILLSEPRSGTPAATEREVRVLRLEGVFAKADRSGYEPSSLAQP
jgi:hypothetical protein